MPNISDYGEELLAAPAWVTSRIRARFVNEEHDRAPEGPQHSVEPGRPPFTLTGTVIAPFGRTKATTVAKGTAGANRVVNRLTIGPRRILG